MSPHDQQLEVEISIAITLPCVVACVARAPSPATSPCSAKTLGGFNQRTGKAEPGKLYQSAEAVPLQAFAGEGARAT